jgi:HEAT repeat protein
MALLTNIAAELRGFVGTAIPQVIDLLQHDDWYAREAGAEALSKLSEQGT